MLRIFRESTSDIFDMKKYMIGYDFNIPIQDEDLQQIINFGGILDYYFSSINAISVYLPESAIPLLNMFPNIRYIEEDAIVHILGGTQFNDPGILAEEVPWGIDKVRAREVHNTGNKGTGIKVCVIDTGIIPDHEDLAANFKGGYDMIDKTTTLKDDCGHGTHVAGIIAAVGNNNLGVIGVAPEAHIYAVRVLKYYPEDKSCGGVYVNIIAGIQWAIDNKMQVINMSFGGGKYSQALNDICRAAYNSGIVLCAAAGNNNGTGKQDKTGYPARFNPCIGIAATDVNDARASFSSQGLAVEVAAPGVSILSTVPKGGAPLSDSSGYKLLSGTSMATPHACGVAALILKAHPNWTNKQVRGAMTQGVVHLGDPGRNWQFGFGRLDAKKCVDITNPPAPPADMVGKACTYAEKDFTDKIIPTCGTIDAKVLECDTYCDCPTQNMHWRCAEWPPNSGKIICGLGYVPRWCDYWSDDVMECRSKCEGAVPQKYDCINNQCVSGPTGRYNSLQECQAACGGTTCPIMSIQFNIS